MKTLPLSIRFWKYVNRLGQGECWQWTGNTSGRDMRGSIKLENSSKNTYAHRASCVNPAHLWLGTHADNMADMARKRRSCCRDRPENYKLTDGQRAALPNLFWLGCTSRQIAEAFGVCKSTINNWRGRLP